MEHNTTGDIDKCPFMSGDQKKSAGEGTSNRDWWPNELKLNILRQNASKSNPMGNEFEYAKAFNSINFKISFVIFLLNSNHSLSINIYTLTNSISSH